MRTATRSKRDGIILFAVATAALLGATAIYGASSGSDAGASHEGAPLAASTDAEAAAAHAARGQEPAYEGGRTACRRCHLREFNSWRRTPHANAYETLPAENRTNPDCVKCHVTGYGHASGFTSIEATPDLANVTCEVCHGPGSLYKDEELMKDRDAAIAAGLVIPTESTCVQCHNSESPTFPGTFDFASMVEAGVHEISR
jgi:hypothetical protein